MRSLDWSCSAWTTETSFQNLKAGFSETYTTNTHPPSLVTFDVESSLISLIKQWAFVVCVPSGHATNSVQETIWELIFQTETHFWKTITQKYSTKGCVTFNPLRSTTFIIAFFYWLITLAHIPFNPGLSLVFVILIIVRIKVQD